MNVHPCLTREQRAEHRAAQIRHFAVTAIGVLGATSTIALSGIPWAALSAFVVTLALGLVVADPVLPDLNRAWIAPPAPVRPLDLVEVITAVEPIPDDDMAIAHKVGVIGRHCREGREAKTVFLHAPAPVGELVSAGGDNGGDGGD